LLYQHKEQLVSSPEHWYTDFIYWLVRNPVISYILFLLSTLMELGFLAGFFTKKFDRWLIRFFLLFIVADLLVMKINYFEVLPFLLILYYSRYEFPVNKTAWFMGNLPIFSTFAVLYQSDDFQIGQQEE